MRLRSLRRVAWIALPIAAHVGCDAAGQSDATGEIDAADPSDAAGEIDAAAPGDAMSNTPEGAAESGPCTSDPLDAGVACPKPGSAPQCGGGTAQASDVVVSLGERYQSISGFGASTAWGSTMSTADADTLWSTTTGAGLSLHRVRIDYQTGHTSEIDIAKLAVAHGVRVWATPWTPPAADKTGATGAHSEVEGALANGAAFGTFLADFVHFMKDEGVPIYAVSAQNEPEANVDYESCKYTPASLASFIGSHMAPALAASGVKIMAPETQNWCSGGFPAFEKAIFSDTSALAATSIFATHEYGCSPAAYPEIQKAGKEFWITEIYDQGQTAPDPGIDSGLRVAKLIHDAMTIAGVNAWHYWWVYPYSADNGALWDKSSGAPSKRLWVEGNYARFVRPGFVRLGTGGTAPAGVLVSAYQNPSDGTIAVVVINDNTNATPLSLFFSGAAPCAITPWVTSSSDSLASKPKVAIDHGRTRVTLPARSVTTLVGKP